jgi:outer membrane protein assembly factor BamA
LIISATKRFTLWKRHSLWLILTLGVIQFSLANEKLPVSRIQLIGNQNTRPWVIKRELTFQEGDSLPEDQLYEILAQNQRNVHNLNLFLMVHVMPVRKRDSLEVQIWVKERFPLGGQPIFAIQERNSYDIVAALTARDFHRLVYGGYGVSRNLTGRGELIDLTLQWGFSRRVRLRLERPNILPRFNVDLRMGASYTRQPEIMVGTVRGQVQWIEVASEPLQRSYEVFLGLNKRFGLYKSLYTELSYAHYRLADSLYAFTLEGTPHRYLTGQNGREQFLNLNVIAEWDRRDWRSFPMAGYQLRLMGRLAGGPGATTRFAKVGASWAQYVPLTPRFNLAYGFQSIYTFGRDVPFFEKSQVGILRYEFPGISTELRGYEPYIVDGTFLNLAKTELKFALFPYQNLYWEWVPLKSLRSFALGCYLSTFVDLGYVSDQSINNHDTFLKEKLLSGYGVGLNLIGIYDMLVRVELTRNHLGQSGIYLHGTLSIK